MNCPKVSIITISFNSVAEIEDTIKSVVSQNYENKEYLIIDGGSKDGTLEIVNRYRNQIDYLISEPDKGISDAFNKGIKAATGDYIVMLNAGDMLTPNALNDFAKYYEPGYDVIKGNTIRWDEDTGYKSVETPVINYPAIPFNFLVCHQSTYISKSTYENVGGYLVDFKVAMDFELMLRMTKAGCKFRSIPADLAIFRMGGISQMSKQRRYDEMKKAMQLNGRTWFQTAIFMTYVHLRTNVRNFLNKINPDLKNRIVTHTIKD
jgi:glycosyltransferase involved in cell wall biosynthesis